MPTVDLGKIIPTINGKDPVNGTLSLNTNDIPYDETDTAKSKIDKMDAAAAAHLAENAKKLNYYATLEEFVVGEEPEYWDAIIDQIFTLALANNTSYKVNLESREYKFTSTHDFVGLYGINFIAANPLKTKFRFVNTVQDKVFMYLNKGSSGTTFENINFVDDTPGTSICFKLTDNITPYSNPNWHNRFVYCKVYRFKIGVNFTTANPRDGSTHSFLDATLFDHCKLYNCRTAFLNQNTQACNITLMATDVENDDAGETYTMIRDEAGQAFNIFGGSFIGRGKIIELCQYAGSSGLFGACRYNFVGTRFEVRPDHTPYLIDMLTGVDYNNNTSLQIKITFDKCNFLPFGQTVRLNHTVRTNIVITDSDVLGGYITAYDTPTQGLTAYDTIGSTSSIVITDSNGFLFERDTASDFGTYGKKYSSSVIINNKCAIHNNNSLTVDDVSFLKPVNENYNHLGYGLNNLGNKLIFNDNNPTTGITAVKMRLPKYARPIKIIAFKHPLDVAESTIDVYIVKDKNYWVNPASFDYATDAILVQTITLTGKAGYFETPFQMTTRPMGYYLQVGMNEGTQTWTWNEGRLYFKHTNTQGYNFPGFMGIEYM